MNKVLRILKIILFIITLIAIAIYLFNNQSTIKKILTTIPTKNLFGIVSTYCFIFLIQALILKKALENSYKNCNYKIHELLYINSLSTLLGSIIPSGATTSKPLLLKSYLKLPLKKGIYAVSKILIINLICNIFIIAILSTVFFKISFFSYLSIIIGFIVTFIFFISQRPITNFLFKKFGIKGESRFTKKDLIIYFFSLLQIIAFSIILWSYMVTINSEISIQKAIFITSIGNLSMLISLTPNNIGIKESIYYLLSQKLSIDSNILVSVIIIDRVVQLVCVFSSVALLYLLKKDSAIRFIK